MTAHHDSQPAIDMPARRRRHAGRRAGRLWRLAALSMLVAGMGLTTAEVLAGSALAERAIASAPDDTTPPPADEQPVDTAGAPTTDAAVPTSEPALPADGESTSSDGFPWIWVVAAGVAAVALLALVSLISSISRRRTQAAWQDDAARLVQDGLVIVDLATPDPRAGNSSCGRETLMAIEERLDRFIHRAGPIRQNAPTLRAREQVENVGQSATAFASAVMADRAIRDGVTAQAAQQQAYSTQRVVERMREFDLNLRALSWLLQELP